MAKSPEEMAAAMLANLKEKTGKSLPQWLAITRKSGLAKHGQLVKLLKSEHGVTHGFASLIAHKTLESRRRKRGRRRSGGSPSTREPRRISGRSTTP